MKITGQFKTYDDLLIEYGYDVTDPNVGPIDETFKGFLKKIQNQKCVLANYNPWSKTFDTTLLQEDPDRPGVEVQTMLDGIQRGFGDNMGISKLAVINQDATDTYIWCTNCGFIAAKDTRYDFEPTFTYGDIFNNDLSAQGDRGTKTLTKTILKANQDGKIYCPKCRKHSEFKTVQDSLV